MIVRTLGRVDFESTAAEMRAFTDARTNESDDELWIVEHDPVFTQGVAGKPEHLLINPQNIPVVKTDRGGQITYHGPGQTVVYVMFNLKRAGYGVRELVIRIENAVIATLNEFNVEAYGKRDAPGVYVNEAKIASLGLKIRNGHSYHGVALNVNMDLTPFSFINPCGYEGLRVTHLHEFGVDLPANDVGIRLSAQLERTLIARP
jgi:lipoyl(octanoyl) transferase